MIYPVLLLYCSLPRFTPPKSTYFIDVLQDAFVIAVVSFAVGVSLAKVFAREFNYTISPNQVWRQQRYTYYENSYILAL